MKREIMLKSESRGYGGVASRQRKGEGDGQRVYRDKSYRAYRSL